jgi:Kdo2-lipid IVA lauroyltransferase/acyltransferase
VPDSSPTGDAAKSGGSRSRPISKSRRTRFGIEAGATIFALLVFKAIPLDLASTLGGLIFQRIGPFLRAHKTAERNIKRALPDLTETEVQSTLRGMWDNLGRVAAEYPHLTTLARDEERVEIVDLDNLIRTMRDEGKGGLLLSAHFGNWELSCLPGFRAGIIQYNVYRPPNNPYADWLIHRLRRSTARGELIPKGYEGFRRMLALLRDGGHIGMLVDQRHGEGVPIPFFGRDAATTTAPATLARRFGIPVLLGKVERIKGAHFRITLSRLVCAEGGNASEDIIETTRRLNAVYESWIRERPDLWLWAHRRWPD